MITNHDQRPDAGRLPTHGKSRSALEAFSATQPPETGQAAHDGLPGAAICRPGITRRAVLAGTGTAAVTSTAAALAIIPVVQARQQEDAALVALWRKLENLEAESNRVLAHLEALERQYPEFTRENPPSVRVEADYGQGVVANGGPSGPPYTVKWDPDKISRYLGIRSEDVNEFPRTAQYQHRNRVRDGLIAEMEEKRRRWTAGRDRVGITAAHERLDEISDAEVEVEDLIIAAPAAGLVGLVIKLALGVKLLDGDDDWPTPIFVAAHADAVRLAGRAS